jgi:tetratricopeptide (TPR) repeat protein
MLEGAITSIEGEYVIGLTAIDCRTGNILARAQDTSEDKKHVLTALSKAATSIRTKLGESLSTVEKFDTPVEQATTPSLEALKAYSLGTKARREKGDAEAIPFFKNSIELDPNFAMAYAVLGLAYANLGQAELASANTSKAFELRDRVSEREKLSISAAYYAYVTEELDKEIAVYQLWTQSYPDDEPPRTNLGASYGYLGQWDKALTEFKEALRLKPDDVVAYGDLAACYLALNQPEEAKQVFDQALSRKVDNWGLRLNMYFLALLRGDVPDMERQVAWAAGKPGVKTSYFRLNPTPRHTMGVWGEHASLLFEQSTRLGGPMKAKPLPCIRRTRPCGRPSSAMQLKPVRLPIPPWRLRQEGTCKHWLLCLWRVRVIRKLRRCCQIDCLRSTQLIQY